MNRTDPTRAIRAIVTGSAGGIGSAIARGLAAHAQWLILVGRNEDALRALQRSLGANTHVVAGDLTQAATLDAIVQLARSLGGLNLLVNNAGVCDFHAFETQDPVAIRSLVDTNLVAPMLLSRAVLPLLQAAAPSQIINVGSLFGFIGYPGFSAYGASKAGLRAFTQALRRELADTGVDARHFVPRATRTGINSERVVALNRDLRTVEDSPEMVASQFQHFLAGRHWETKIGAKETFFAFVNSLLPAMPDRAIRAQLPVIRKHMPK
ncbi:SDR family oxidoreductase [Noviherbaspirillum sp. ST9]|uniref:SDR family oxidoreductase n=1 Tax=Noviherbaspirillum sp. ST9 TaxID=3401606 RepID=UPI003B587D5F